jgi:hypothetical protein
MARKPETFRTLYCDPGEDFGWAIGRDTKLLARGTTKMWDMAMDIHRVIIAGEDSDPSNPLNDPNYVRAGVDPDENKGPIGRIVCESFRLYPWVARTGALDFDEMRTPQVIGAVRHMARVAGIPMHFQPAAIKPAAVAAGAEELYDRPLRENRHQNDAIQHFVFWTNVELLGLRLPIPAQNEQEQA